MRELSAKKPYVKRVHFLVSELPRCKVRPDMIALHENTVDIKQQSREVVQIFPRGSSPYFMFKQSHEKKKQ